MDDRQNAARLHVVRDLITDDMIARSEAGSVSDRAKIVVYLALAPLREPLDGGDWLYALVNWLNGRDPEWISNAGHDYAAGIAAEFSRRGMPLPAPLDQFVTNVLEGRVARRERGPRRYLNDWRDTVILDAIYESLAVKGTAIKATRNDASDPESACDLVAECLNDLGHDLTYRAVASIWENWQERLNT